MKCESSASYWWDLITWTKNSLFSSCSSKAWLRRYSIQWTYCLSFSCISVIIISESWSQRNSTHFISSSHSFFALLLRRCTENIAHFTPPVVPNRIFSSLKSENGLIFDLFIKSVDLSRISLQNVTHDLHIFIYLQSSVYLCSNAYIIIVINT